MDKVPRCPVEREFERKSAHEILQSMEASNHSIDICSWGMRAFASIAGSALLAQDTHGLAEFLDDGGCEALVGVMNKYCDCSEIIASYGCLTVSILAWSMNELKEFLGELGACEIVVYAVSMHLGHADVSEFGTRAICALARQNITNSFKLSAAGACEVLVQVGNFGFNLRDERSGTVAANYCTAVALLSEAINASRLHDFGSAALCCELIKFHYKDDDFACAAVKALCALGSLSAHLREDLGRAGACNLLVDMLRVHDSSLIGLEGCEAILHLSLNPNNADRLSSAGSCELVVALGNKLIDVAFGPEVCTGAMLHLATYGVCAKDSRERLLQCGAREQLKAAQFSVKASYKARENIQQLFDLMGSDSDLLGALLSRETIVIHGSEMKGNTLPLQVEVREEELPDDDSESSDDFPAEALESSPTGASPAIVRGILKNSSGSSNTLVNNGGSLNPLDGTAERSRSNSRAIGFTPTARASSISDPPAKALAGSNSFRKSQRGIVFDDSAEGPVDFNNVVHEI